MEDRERRSPANAEEATEEGSNEDVELHRRKSMPQADAGTPSEGQSDDDVELHRKQNPA